MRKKLLLLLCLCIALPLTAQTVNDLKKRKQKAMQNLEATSKMLTKTQKNTKQEQDKLVLLNAEIKEQKELINVLNAEIDNYNTKLSRLRTETNEKKQKLESLKAEYAKLMYHSYYKKSRYENLMFILSSSRLDEILRRYRYVKQYASHCSDKMQEIERVKKDLDDKIAETEQVRTNRMQSLSEKKRESKNLEDKKDKQTKLVTNLKKKEKDLKATLKKQQKIADNLNSQIEKKIAEEARKQAEAAKKKQQASGKNNTKQPQGTTQPAYQMTKEEKLVSGNFAQNKGRLPWPVEKGLITGHYGIHPHPVLQHVTTNNKGIYIQCPKGSNARAVFDGEVTQTFAIPGSNNAVIIKHGIYRTVYANLIKVNVKVGEKVTAKQTIGRIYTDTEDNKTELYFQVWNDRTLQDPEAWLAK
ncbi:MAG: peptidoglycan DD-metalloendopeptidase family protein [Paludibacteraceae bacterium]|nr:peptidoglycan DD-metalloendopeptidase family protein [Paludibacteraceae bacterium]